MRLAICFPSFKARITMTWQTWPGSVSSISKYSYWRNQAGRQNQRLRKPKGIAGTVSGNADPCPSCSALRPYLKTVPALVATRPPDQFCRSLWEQHSKPIVLISLSMSRPIRSGLLHVIQITDETFTFAQNVHHRPEDDGSGCNHVFAVSFQARHADSGCFASAQ